MKAFLKRFSCLVLALVLMVCLLPNLTPKAQAVTADETVKAAEEVVKAFSQLNKADASMIFKEIDLIFAKSALEQKIATGGLAGAALAQAKVILLEIQTKISTIGIKPATLTKFFKYAVIAGIVIEITDWQNVWDAIFNGEEFFEERYVKMATPLHSAVVNYTNLDDQFTALVHRIDKLFFSDGSLTSDFDYVECTNEGWQTISNGFKNFFGITDDTPSGKTQTQPMGLFQAFDLTGCKVIGSNINALAEQYYYEVPVGWTFVHPRTGRFIGQTVQDGRKMIYGEHTNNSEGKYMTGYLGSGYDKKYNVLLVVVVTIKSSGVASNKVALRMSIRLPNDTTSSFSFVYGVGMNDYYDLTHDDLGIPSTTFTNNYPDLKREIDSIIGDNDPDKPLVFPLPPYNPDPGKTDEENMVDYIGTFPQTPVIPQIGGDPATDPNNPTDPNPTPQPTPKPDTETPTEPDPEQTKKKLDFSPLLSFTGLAEVFPFCLPWDMVNFFKSLNAPRQTPKIEFTLPAVLYNTKVVIDLSVWDTVAVIVRNLIAGLFILGLILVSRNMIKW